MKRVSSALHIATSGISGTKSPAQKSAVSPVSYEDFVSSFKDMGEFKVFGLKIETRKDVMKHKLRKRYRVFDAFGIGGYVSVVIFTVEAPLINQRWTLTKTFAVSAYLNIYITY